MTLDKWVDLMLVTLLTSAAFMVLFLIGALIGMVLLGL